MDGSTLPPIVNTTTNTTSSAANASQQLAGNFNTFLQLLTTQLQYQDPTAPMDSNQFTSQLVQFADVEQEINANSNLEKLVNFSLSNTTSSAAGYIGRQVTAGGDTAALTNGQAHWTYSLAANTADTAITVSDAAGNVVYQTKGANTAGGHVLDWDGRMTNGDTAPDGTYSISLSAADQAGNSIATSTSISGVVSAVDIQNGQPMLKINGLDISPSDVTNISPTATATVQPTT